MLFRSVSQSRYEVQEHSKRGRATIARPVQGIANVRQWIVDQHTHDDTVIMCDDDLGFFIRANAGSWNLKPANIDEATCIFEDIHEVVETGEFGHSGLTPRQMNNVHFPDTWIYSAKMNAVHCVSKSLLHREKIKYNDVELMEDYYVTLSLLRKGYNNKIFCAGAWDQRGVSGAPVAVL